jgi:alkanesulfonate monooxygenase SsuD/methylene tetrahydromethanopterin reductase-like flavin-dependent oxidoreductase (luciferase family)
MPLSILRFNFVLPGRDPATLSSMYRAAIEMAAVADANNFMAVTLEEHHGVDNGWSPAPLTVAGLILGRTKTLRVMVQALLVPLNDPLRVAEAVAVLDLASGGRINVVAGLGYRPEEYAAAGADWKGRGALMDESLDAIINAWTGEEFSYRGRQVTVTPTPLTPAAGILFVGGSGRPAARRAARLGLGLLPAANLPELASYYEEQCKEHGTTPLMIMPPENTSLTLIAEDPDKAWAELGDHLLHEAQRYGGLIEGDEYPGAPRRGHLPDPVPGPGDRDLQGRGRLRLHGAAPAVWRRTGGAGLGHRQPLRREGPACAGVTALTRWV